MVAERAVKICHAHSAQTPHKHCEYSVLSEKNGPRIGSVIHEHYLERDNYLHMALEGPKRRKGRRKLCWKAWVVFKICAWLANYFLLSGPSNRRGTCSRPAHRLLHKTKSDHSGCSYASQNNVCELYFITCHIGGTSLLEPMLFHVTVFQNHGISIFWHSVWYDTLQQG